MNQIHEVMGSLECEYEVLFVDDGSTDGSFGVLQQLTSLVTLYASIGSVITAVSLLP